MRSSNTHFSVGNEAGSTHDIFNTAENESVPISEIFSIGCRKC